MSWNKMHFLFTFISPFFYFSNMIKITWKKYNSVYREYKSLKKFLDCVTEPNVLLFLYLNKCFLIFLIFRKNPLATFLLLHYLRWYIRVILTVSMVVLQFDCRFVKKKKKMRQRTAEAPAALCQSWTIFSSNPRLQI